MPRSQMRHNVKDAAGNVIQNALCVVYVTGTLNLVSDMYAAASGGSPITTLTSNAQGDIEGWFDAAQTVDIKVTDNSDAAYYPSQPTALLSWSDFTETVQVGSASLAASAVSFSPTGTIAATDVQSAIAEVASESTVSLVQARTTAWQTSPYLATPVGTAFALLSRVQYTPFFLPRGTGVTAIAVNMTAAGTASNVLRIGLYEPDATTRLPGVLVEQGTVTGDSIAIKTLTLSATRTVSGLFWIAVCPQGSSSAGSVWMSSGGTGMPQPDTGASWSALAVQSPSYRLDSVTGSFADNPSVVSDGTTQRFIWAAVRVA